MNIEKEFPALNRRFRGKKMIYIDSACSALKMASSISAERKFLANFGGCAGKRSVHILSQEAGQKYEEARNCVAQSIGAFPEEIIFTSGTTEAVNILASAFVFSGERKEVLLSPLEHNSVFLPFLKLENAGRVKLRIIPLKGCLPNFEIFKKMINKKVALVCITRASNVFGSSIDVEKFIDVAHDFGAKVFVDEAQYIPSHREDMRGINTDFAAFSGHKMGAPYGTGVLYVRSDLLSELARAKVGGGIVKEIYKRGRKYYCEYIDGNVSFEAGIQNYAGAVALAESFRVLEKIGFKKIREQIARVIKYAYKKISLFGEIRIIGDLEQLQKGSILSFTPVEKNFSLEDFNIYLNNYSNEHFIAIRTGRHCADLTALNSGIKSIGRLSFYIYSKEEDIDIFCSALKKYIAEIK